MFAIYVYLCPALVTLEPPQRLRLMRVTFQKFFPWVWISCRERVLAYGRALLAIRRRCKFSLRPSLAGSI